MKRGAITSYQIKLIKASIDQKPILANLLELYSYDLTDFADFDLQDSGFFGYEYLPLYWTDSNRHPFIIYVDDKIAGLVFVIKGCPITGAQDVWDMSEFFIIRKYRQHGVGTIVANKIWQQFKGKWQVRVYSSNLKACAFWQKTINEFLGHEPDIHSVTHKGFENITYSFESH